MKTWCVYRHVSPSGKSYIGITSQKPKYRFGKGGNGYAIGSAIQNAIQKYGWDNFEHIILYSNLTKDEACKLEQEMIQKYNSLVPNGYNLSLGGESGSYGYKYSKEQSLAKSLRQKGKHRKPMSEETKQKISKTKTGHKMGPRPKEWTKKIADANRGKKRNLTPEQRKSFGNGMRGKHHTKETKQKISEASKLNNKLNTPEIREKSRNAIRVPIIQYDNKGNIIHVFETSSECAKYLHVSVALVSRISKYESNKYNIRRGNINEDYNNFISQ